MSSPTSAPKSSTPRKHNNLKLRASCDSCAASKVKCSKDHPICARCSAINSPCIYGVSRKHGKPGRKRKRNVDGTPFVKVAEQRLSPGGRDFSKFMLQPESAPQQASLEIASNWASDWSPTPSLPAIPGFGFETVSELSFENVIRSDTAFMGTAPLPDQQAQSEPMPTIESNYFFQDPSTEEKQTLQSDPLDWQALKYYTGNREVNPMDYYHTSSKTADHLRSASSVSVPYSPMSQVMGSHNAMAPSFDSSINSTHCCYTLAYSALDSLRHLGYTHPAFTKGPFNAVLPTVQSVTRNVLQLLKCPCSSDPHLAMLYSSITSKILIWYRTAAGVHATIQSSALVSAPFKWDNCQHPPLFQAVFPSPSVPSNSEGEDFNLYVQSCQHQQFDFEDLEQQKCRRQMVLHELRGYRQLVEALANWRGNSPAREQAEFLYDILGGWLKSELCKTVKEIEKRNA